jgi:hypothetical protein
MRVLRVFAYAGIAATGLLMMAQERWVERILGGGLVAAAILLIMLDVELTRHGL